MIERGLDGDGLFPNMKDGMLSLTDACDSRVADFAVPDRDAVPPPDLPGHTPVLDVVHPA
jgi:hypothetical protein